MATRSRSASPAPDPSQALSGLIVGMKSELRESTGSYSENDAMDTVELGVSGPAC